MKRVNVLRGAALAMGLVAASGAMASNVTFTGSDGYRAASATFAVQAGDLVVTLTNTSAEDVLLPIHVLTGVFFDFNGTAPVLTRNNAALGSGSAVLFPSSGSGTDPMGVVGGEWAYVAAGFAGGPRGAHYGISSSGLGLFGPPDLFPGTNLDGPDSPDGLGYGITSAGDNPATGNAPVTGDYPLIQNEVVFTLGNLPAGFNPATDIGNVSFQYGTALDDPNLPSPTPGTAAILGLGAIGMGRRRRR